MNAIPATVRRAGSPDQEVRYWMATPAVTINLAAPLSEALALMHDHRIRRLPVVLDNGTLCGIITQGDIRGAEVLRAAGVDLLEIAETLRGIKTYEVMTEDPLVIASDTSLSDAARLMIDNKIGGLPVVEGDGVVVGIVTESDLFEALVCYLQSANADGERGS